MISRRIPCKSQDHLMTADMVPIPCAGSAFTNLVAWSDRLGSALTAGMGRSEERLGQQRAVGQLQASGSDLPLRRSLQLSSEHHPEAGGQNGQISTAGAASSVFSSRQG